MPLTPWLHLWRLDAVGRMGTRCDMPSQSGAAFACILLLVTVGAAFSIYWAGCD